MTQQTIGPYRLREKLGEGGFGEVYVADQSEPVQRRVALKLLKAGMDTRAVLARFEAERQALARMDHPNIAHVLDAGATERGRPYFVMDLVKGEAITAYCDRHTLGVRDRLELFIAVCNAVQHAHQKGVIHRDLKPSNILVALVDDVPVPKVIDFGIAKATSGSLTPETIYTMQGELIGTPEYMSPEQAEMGSLDVDTRADVYSLGVILYELLSGTLPFESATLRRAGLSEIQRIIREQEPPRPSTRVTAGSVGAQEIARRRGTEIRSLARALRDDLDWIVLKAMEKDRTRRYETANALAQEIRRYLNDEPVLAGPPQASYRMRKFLRRHRAAAASGGVIALGVLIAMLGSVFGLVRAQHAERETRREAATTKKVLDFMVGLFQVANPTESRGNTITVREILDKGAAEITKGLEAEPLVQARLMYTMGNVYHDLGLYDPAKELLEQSLAIREKVLAPDDTLLADSYRALSKVLGSSGAYAEARQYSERALAIQEKAFGSESEPVAWTLMQLSGMMREIGDYDGSRRTAERALAIRERILGPNHLQVAADLTNIAAALQQMGDYQEGRRLFERALAIREKALPSDHVDVAAALNNLATACWTMEDLAEAKTLWERSLAVYEKNLGPDHPTVATITSNLGSAYLKLGDYCGAESLYTRALAIRERKLGPSHPQVGLSLYNLAGAVAARRDFAEARRLLDRALEVLVSALGPDHAKVADARLSLAEVYRDAGDTTRALEQFELTVAIFEKALGPDHPSLQASLSEQAALLRAAGRTAQADSAEARIRAIQERRAPKS